MPRLWCDGDGSGHCDWGTVGGGALAGRVRLAGGRAAGTMEGEGARGERGWGEQQPWRFVSLF